MFKFLKDKLKSWLGKSEKEIEKKAKKQAKPKEKPKKEEKIKEKAVKPKKEKTKKTELEIKNERSITSSIMADVAKEGLEIKNPEQQVEEEIQKEGGFFSKIRKFFGYQITETDFEELFEELELLLLENNVAIEVVEKIKSELKTQLINKEMKKESLGKEIKSALKKSLEDILIQPEDTIEKIKQHKRENTKEPYKILFFGINGAGKTTSIAKFAHLCLKNKISCILAAADTFRAASIEQLQIHADKLGVKMIKHTYNSDPSAVAFDAIKYAEQNNVDVVLIDTAGRMHTKENLLHEMEKISRVTKPNLKVFVAEAIAGNDATEQAKAFNEMIGIDGSILSKTDVDEKGGTIISISYITKKPILYLGVGQEYKDLELFNKKKFIERLGL